MHRQISEYFETVLSKLQCGFQNWYSTQDCHPRLNKYDALLTDLFHMTLKLRNFTRSFDRSFDSFWIESLKLINSYLTERKQRVKMNDQFSSCLDIVVSAPQGSILGPLLFNIFLCDMFLFCSDKDFASYADNSTSYKTPEEVISQLEKSSKFIFEWFETN